MSSLADTQSIVGPQPLEYGSPIGVATATAPEGMTFQDVVRIFKQRRISLSITFIAVYALVVAATFTVLRYFPGYTSEAYFELDPPRRGIFVTDEGIVPPKNMEEMLKTEARKLVQKDLLYQVLAQPDIKQTAYYRWYKSDADLAAEGLQDDLSVTPVPNTRLIRVALTCRNPEEARAIVRAVVDRYRENFLDAQRNQALKELETLRNSLDRLHTELEQKRAEAAAFRERAEIPALESARSAQLEYIATLRMSVDDLQAQIATLQAQMDSIAGLTPDELPLTAEQRSFVESDPLLRFYVSQVENIDVEIQTMLERLGEEHIQVVLSRRRREAYKRKEISRREELITRVQRQQIENLRQAMAQAEKLLAERHEQLEEAEARERDMNRNLQRYAQMQADIHMLERQIEELEAKETEAEHKADDPTRVRLTLVQRPSRPIRPSRPNLKLWLGGGFLLALAAALGVAFLREFSDKAVRTPIDVVRHGQLSVLGIIPLLDDEEADVEEIEDAVRVAPQSLVAEAFRRTRTNLQFSGPREWQRSLLITSPSPGDGKTAVAINLAITLANSGQRVLLVDCNFRRPGIGPRFNGTNSHGLSNVLIGDRTLEECATRSEIPNLDVLPTGPMAPTPAELLGSENMRKLLDDALTRYDRVVLDGPPALLISDATVLATLVDGVILVIRADENTKGLVRRAREQLEKISARVLGAILNGVRARAGGYFREQYREFYEYTSDETIPRELPFPEGSDESPASQNKDKDEQA